MNDIKEIKQKYIGCWLPLKKGDITKYAYLQDAVASQQGGTLFFTNGAHSWEVELNDLTWTVSFTNPNTGFVWLPYISDTVLLLRKAEKQFRRGFHAENYHSTSLTRLAIRQALAGNNEVAVNASVNAIGKGVNIFGEASYVKAAYERNYCPLDKAVTNGYATAISQRLAVVPSSSPKYDLDIFRELYKIGTIKGKKMYTTPLFHQELCDFVRRRGLDWEVYNATK